MSATRAPAHKADARDRLRRVLFLVPYAVRHPGIPVRELAGKCGVSEKQLLDDLDFLLGVGCPPFAPDDFLDLYVERDRVYVALHQSFSRPPRFTESEAAALAAAAQALGGEGAARVVRALRESVPRDRRALFDELVHRIYAGSAPARDSLLGRIHRAIAERRVLRLRYFAATRGAEGERAVRPWTLAQALGHWYLYGEEAGRRKAFRLDRIRECALSEERFEPPPEAEVSRARLFSEPRAAARVRLGRRAAALALSRPGRYRVVKRSAGGAVVELQAEGEDWATRFALSHGAEAQITSPPSARRHYAETVRRTLARYRR
ncbi:MAG TPA: WYL domain-containing protein [Anaeromyxobacteraceae bacterium]|nr:WYL domain-containing protein [Anaeromyxobacteraceae bacterium]